MTEVLQREYGMKKRFLAGDVGGTKAVIGLFGRGEGGRLEIEREASFATSEYAGLGEMVTAFLKGSGAPRSVAAACFGVAGPVREGRCEGTNFSWTMDAQELSAETGIRPFHLINDLVATGHGIATLPAEAFEVLQEGVPGARGNAVLIAAGTGLGEAILFWDGEGWLPSPSEGGHSDFAPSNETEDALLAFLRREFGHVSYERVLSGPGLYHIYMFLRATGRGREPEPLAARIARSSDPSAVIAEAALAGEFELCAQALDMFVRMYGAEAGNLALKALALGGVLVGGGIAPKILPALRAPAFLEGFRAKGRFSDLLATLPVRVILEPRAAFFGAACCAAGATGGAARRRPHRGS